MYRSPAARSTLEVLILSFLKQGMTTTYDLQKQAGLSLGATVPALKRLATAKLVTKKASGRRIEFSLTREGGKVLISWTAPGRAPSELDDLLRTAYLTWLVGRSRTQAATVLNQGARARRRWVEELEDDSAVVGPSKVKVPDAKAYRWMRTASEAARAAAEAEALEALAHALEPQRKPR
jgi:DNA-binding PadR family transcriptional regulator